MEPPWQTVVQDLAARCAQAGLDLVQPFQVAWYNNVAGSAFKLPDFGRPSALGVLIGNTRALWPRFLDALHANPRIDGEHPLDDYVAGAVLRAVRPLGLPFEARFAQEPPPRRVAMQRLAHIAGLAYLSPSHLSVHPVYGPWIALRAAVAVEVDGPPGPPPEPRNPCPDCERDCLPRFRRAVAAGAEGRENVERHWRLWLAVRDACPIGRAHRYGDEQIRYHYTKDRGGVR